MSNKATARKCFNSNEVAEFCGVSLRQLQWWDEHHAPICRSPEISEGDQLRSEIAALGEKFEFDRTVLADAITGIKKACDSRFWLTEGRGSYEWDDDRYRDEFREAYQEISKAIEPLKKIAADWSGCPKKAEDVAKARIDLKAENQQLRAENAALQAWLGRDAIYAEIQQQAVESVERILRGEAEAK